MRQPCHLSQKVSDHQIFSKSQLMGECKLEQRTACHTHSQKYFDLILICYPTSIEILATRYRFCTTTIGGGREAGRTPREGEQVGE